MGRAQDMKVLLRSFFFSFFFSPLKDRYGRVRVLYSGAGNQVLRDGRQVVGMDVMA